jgi:hypothetical protein
MDRCDLILAIAVRIPFEAEAPDSFRNETFFFIKAPLSFNTKTAKAVLELFVTAFLSFKRGINEKFSKNLTLSPNLTTAHAQ